jgi:hypothetical protein
MNAVRVSGMVPFAVFLFAGYRRLAGGFFPRFFFAAPVRYRVWVSLVFHEYPLQKKEYHVREGGG